MTESAHALIHAAVDPESAPSSGGPARTGIVEMTRDVLDQHGPAALVDVAAVLACIAAEAIESYCRLQGHAEDELPQAVREWLDATST